MPTFWISDGALAILVLGQPTRSNKSIKNQEIIRKIVLNLHVKLVQSFSNNQIPMLFLMQNFLIHPDNG